MSRVIDAKQKKVSSFRDYNDFVKQIEVDDLRIVSAQVNLLDYSYFPSSAEVKWKMRASYEKAEGQFSVSHRYNVTILDKETNEDKAKISVTFFVVYSSKIPISDDFFEIFKVRNLPLNTWPYFREFVHNVIMRMGWPPFIAPTYVV
ncbi:hypothetical protein ES703_79611 [subsurface metagenome]